MRFFAVSEGNGFLEGTSYCEILIIKACIDKTWKKRTFRMPKEHVKMYNMSSIHVHLGVFLHVSFYELLGGDQLQCHLEKAKLYELNNKDIDHLEGTEGMDDTSCHQTVLF